MKRRKSKDRERRYKYQDEASPSDTGVDLARLEWEFARHPRLVEVAIENQVQAKKELREANAELKVIRAEVENAIRDDPKQYGMDEIREAAVKAKIEVQPEYVSAESNIRRLEHLVDLYTARIKVLDDKKRAIEGEITLFGMGYFAKPKVSKEADRKYSIMKRKEDFRRSNEDD